MKNKHDHYFKALMTKRAFFESFIKAYLPKEWLDLLDWSSIQLYKMSGRHRSEKLRKEFEADVIYLARFGDQECLIWFHCEHQTTPDRLMTLRTVNYQSAELLGYAEQNPQKPLPTIITLIYQQGNRPWPHSMHLQDLFAEPQLAMKYFGQPILIDLPLIPDEQLRQHNGIGPVEMVLKYVRRKEFKTKMRILLTELQSVDDILRPIVIE